MSGALTRSRRGSLGRWSTVLVAVVAVLGGLLVAPTATAATPAATVGAEPVKTADLSKFQPGNIISDAVFFNRGTMTEAQIQSFLQTRVPSCQSGYTCLKDWYDTSRTTTADAMCGAYSGGVRERASRIIYKVAQACGINPQVILATLQKEQGLVTHTWPSEWRYTIAMGQGCPDTAACDTRYYGFFNQVFGAAWQLKRYANPPGTSQYFTWYAPGKTWNVRFNPNAACGSSPVLIQNQATANLYYYTPYQPNAAALRAGYGTGDSCSAYGNRNFYQYFTDWFGSTQVSESACLPPTASQVASASGLLVAAAGATARRAPTTDCGDVVASLPAAKLVVRTGTYAGWTRVDVDGSTAWIRDDLVTPLSATAAPTLRLDADRHIFALTSTGSVLAYPFSEFGRWGAAVTVLAGQSLSRLIAVGDLDRDGHRDLVGVTTDAKAVLYRGDGGGLGGPIALPVDWSGARLISGAGDFDGDGVSDVFAVDAAGSLTLWRGDGAGSFHAPRAIGKGWGGISAIVGGTDLSGDGVPDLLARDGAGVMYLYRGDGAGGWSGSGRIGQGWASMDPLVMPGDFTGDTRPDVLTRDANGGLQLYRGTGTAVAFMAQVGTSWGGMLSIVGSGGPVTTPAPAVPPGPAMGDIDGDGATDVVAVAGPELRLYPGNGSGGWLASTVLDPSWPSDARLVRMGDFTGDGTADLGRIGADGVFALLAGRGGGGFDAPTAIGSGWGALSQISGGVDYDGDGRVDVIARDATGRLLLYPGNGAGGWAGTARTVGVGWGGFSAILAPGDFDGDGAADLIARRASDGALLLYPGNGAGGWLTPRQIGVGWGAFTMLIAPGDFDGSGGSDVLARTATGDLRLYRSDGKGGWSGSAPIGSRWNGVAQAI